MILAPAPPAYPRSRALRPLLGALRTADPPLWVHSWRVAVLAGRLGLALRADPTATAEERALVLSDLWLAGLLHDCGKLAWPADLRAGVGTRRLALILAHPVAGAALLPPPLAALAPWIRHHHEWWDGGGYPAGFCGITIPAGARVLAVADAYAAMIEARPYQAARTPAQALQELSRGAATQFDPLLVRLVARLYALGQWPGAPGCGEGLR